MFWTVFKFEIAYWLRRPLTLFFFGLLFFLAFTTTGVEGFSHGTATLKLNSTYLIAQAMAQLVAIGQIITTAIAGTAVVRDQQLGTEEMLFTTRLSKAGYLLGRFAGAVIVMMLLYLALPVGLLLGMLMPWLTPEKLGPISLGLVFQPFLTIALPNLLLVSAVFFAIGALTRKLIAVYVAGFGMFVAWTIMTEVATQIDRVTLGALLDPFALTTIDTAVRYWSVAEKNSRLIPFEGLLLQNRLLWIAIALALFGVVAALFRLRLQHGGARRSETAAEAPSPAPMAVAVPQVALRYDRAAWWRAFVTQVLFHVRSIVREAPFVAIATISVIVRFVNIWFTAHPQDSLRWPVTSLVAERLASGMFPFVAILATLYGGELVWRERQQKSDQIQDTAPVPDWVIFGGKLTAVFVALAGLFVVQVGAAMAMQLALGYARLQPGVYFQIVVLGGLPNVLALVAFAMAVHALVNQKFVGHLIVIAYWMGLPLLSNAGFDHRLYQVGLNPFFTFSDMNGWGPYATRVATQGFYSAAVGLLLATLGYLVLVRGTDEGWKARKRAAAVRWQHGAAMALASFAIAAIGLGSFFFFNVNVLNAFTEVREAEAGSKAWELKYKPLENLPQPRLVGVSLRQDYFPERRAAAWRGTLKAVNRSGKPIDTLFISYPRSAPIPTDRYTATTNSGLALDSLVLDREATVLVDDASGGVRLYRLAKPLAQGESLSVRFAGRFEPRGFPNDAFNNDVAGNGSFMNSGYIPGFGYREENELSLDDVRKRNGLAPKPRMKSIDDPAVRLNNFTGADWITFDASVCTSPDQIALAPGYLDREWRENGRRCFHYAMDRPILNFYSTLSARYAVTRDSHAGVALEIYHLPEHTYALSSMLQATKDGLDYFTANFSPYLYRQFRVIEFPRYASFAQAFPNTIPYSEGIGFLYRKQEGDDKIDLAYFVTAHELAHQWWAHQVIGGAGQGSTMISEGLAEYSALTVMEKRFGREAAQKFLRRELDEYLRGRGAEEKKEVPLLFVENQPYIHYRKASLAFYALRDYIGEPAMNTALRAFLQKWALKGPPYPTARDLYAELGRVTPDSLKYVLKDLFEDITFYENKADTAIATKRTDGSYDVRLVLRSKKLKGDSIGNTTEVPIADYVDVGVFGERVPGQKLGAPLLVKKVRLTQPVTVVNWTVAKEPVRAGIDPYNKLIDRTPEDNVIAVKRDRP